MGEWVRIIHPGTNGIGEVHQSSLPQWYAAGWHLLTEEEAAALEPEPPPEPEPMTMQQAAQAAAEPEPEEM